MSALSENVLRRIDELISGNPVRGEALNEQLVDGQLQAACVGWLASAGNLIERLIPDSTNSYRLLAKAKQEAGLRSAYFLHAQVADMTSVLEQMKVDAKAGLLSDLEARVSGETFDDVLDHADQYLKEGRHEPAGVLAGVVFEDTVRRLCDKHLIQHRNKDLDAILNALKAKNVLSKLEAKEGVAAADLRGNATHANWAAFNSDQVKAVIIFTRRIIREKLVA